MEIICTHFAMIPEKRSFKTRLKTARLLRMGLLCEKLRLSVSGAKEAAKREKWRLSSVHIYYVAKNIIMGAGHIR